MNKTILYSTLTLFTLTAFAFSTNAQSAEITVNSSADIIADDTFCTLREAVISANADDAGSTNCTPGNGDDSIVFHPSVTTVCLDDDASGAIEITSNLTITGASAKTIVDGTSALAGGTTACTPESFANQIFTITGSGTTVTLTNLTLQNANNAATIEGGAIYIAAETTLSVSESNIQYNYSDGAYAGGGIGNAGTLTITNSLISHNNSTGGGGGIYNQGTLLVTSSTIAQNISDAEAGAIYNIDGTTTIVNSTISGNDSASNGAVFNFNGLTHYLNIISSTVSGNTGGVVSGYTSSFVDLPVAIATTRIQNSIIENNGELDCSGVIDSYGHNLIENYLDYPDSPSLDSSTGCSLDYSNSGADSDTDLINQDIILDALSDNGGSTQTHALGADDIALDAGNCGGISGVDDTATTVDQRGEDRDSLCDIGAFEFQATCGDSQTTGDEECDDGNSDSEDGCSSTCQTESTWYEDSDGDTYGNPDSSTQAVSEPTGYVSDNSDCDDTDNSIHPDATETCGDEIDQDCNSEDLACDATPGDDDDTTGDDDDDDTTVAGFEKASGCSLSAHSAHNPYFHLFWVGSIVVLMIRRQSYSKKPL